MYGDIKTFLYMYRFTTTPLTIPLQSKVRMWASRSPALPRGIKGLEISLQAKKVKH